MTLRLWGWKLYARDEWGVYIWPLGRLIPERLWHSAALANHNFGGYCVTKWGRFYLVRLA